MGHLVGATSYTVRVGTDPALTTDTLVLSTTVHPYAKSGLKTAFNYGSGTQRMAFEPGMTYYWNVTAVNPAGSATSTTVKSFTTAATYDLDFAGKGYVPWRTFGGASITRGDIAVLKFAGATGGIRTGADYAPTRINLSDMDRIQVTFAEGTDPSAIEALVVSYRLQSENRETPVRTISAPVADAVDGVLTIDMTGMPGWGVPGERIAELTIGAAAAGTIRVDSIEVAGPPAVVDMETAAPAVGVLSTTSGWQNGLADGNYEVRLNLWWGANASRVKVYENGVLIHTAELAAAGPAAQSITVPCRDASTAPTPTPPS
ncbi:hypothetical protein G7085_06390 [Tessaracoccus sp. HDW20]|uniref:hypothetical protein n=1 Tax=Tessaracoccus coleopterorum TaxID=2714950 RepID=UPI0018D2F9AA|nr:hypothetical protein [Tessaracoccus coleopterorum]NHB84356.1 hypothetical protein [Tessaracoccus coleopterorum]